MQTDSNRKNSRKSFAINAEELQNGKYVRRDFITENIQACANYKKIEYDEISGNNSRRTSNNSSQSTKNNLTKNLSRIDSETETNSQENQVENLKIQTKKLSCTHNGDKFHLIKQTTCPACMEKWKTPLPVPKTPKLRTSIPKQNNNELSNHYWNSSHNNNRVSSMINKEMYKLDAYNRRFSTDSNDSSRTSSRKSSIQEDNAVNVDTIKNNIIDIKKNELELRRRATQERLENFLRNSI